MLDMLGSKNFTVKQNGLIEDEHFVKVKQFILESRNGNNEEYLYFTEKQIYELRNLLNNTEELL